MYEIYAAFGSGIGEFAQWIRRSSAMDVISSALGVLTTLWIARDRANENFRETRTASGSTTIRLFMYLPPVDTPSVPRSCRARSSAFAVDCKFRLDWGVSGYIDECEPGGENVMGCPPGADVSRRNSRIVEVGEFCDCSFRGLHNRNPVGYHATILCVLHGQLAVLAFG